MQRIKDFRYKLAEISFFIIVDQNLVECMASSFGKFAYFENLNISGTKKRYLKVANSIFFLVEATCLCFEMTSINFDRKDALFVIVPL